MLGNTVEPEAPRLFHNERVWWHLMWLQKTCREHAVPETRPSLLLALIPFPQGPSTTADIWVLWLNQGTWSQEAWSVWSFITEHLLSHQCNEVTRVQATHVCDRIKWLDGMWAHQPPQNPGFSRSCLTLHPLSRMKPASACGANSSSLWPHPRVFWQPCSGRPRPSSKQHFF